MDIYFRLDSKAVELLDKFFHDYPHLFLYEAHDHGVDPLKFPDLYMTDELLTEPEHTLIAQKVLQNRGIVFASHVLKWIEQELQEWQQRKQLLQEFQHQQMLL